MNRQQSSLLTGLILSLTSISSVTAAIPGDNLWRPVGDALIMIWPDYAGSTGHVIDAILMFMIVTMTIVDVSKKTSVPRKAAWAVGIALWLTIMVPMIQYERLLFRNAWFAFIGFLITTIVFASILKGVFEKPFGQSAHKTQWLVSFCIAILAVGSLFATLLQDLEVTGSSEQFIVDFMYACIGLALPLLIITGAYLGIRSVKKNKQKWGDGKREAKSLDKQRRKATKQRIKEENEKAKQQEQEKQHTKYLSGLEQKVQAFDQDVQKINDQDLNDLQAIHQYVQQLQERANDLQKTIRSYYDYIHGSSSRTQKATSWIKNKKTDLGEARKLDDAYYEQLDTIAGKWEQSLESLHKRVNAIRKRRTGIHFKELDKLNKELDKEKETYNKLLKNIANKAQEARSLEKKLDKPVRRLLEQETTQTGPVRRVVSQNQTYQKVKERLQALFKHAQQWKKTLEEKQAVLLEDSKLIRQLLNKSKEYTNDIKNTYKQHHEITDTIGNQLTKAKKHLSEGLKKIKPDSVHDAVKSLQQIESALKDEINQVDTRKKLLNELPKEKQRLQEALNQAHETYQDILSSVAHDYTEASALAEFAEAMYVFEEEIAEIDTNTKWDKADLSEIIKSIDTRINKLHKELHNILDGAENVPGHKEVSQALNGLTDEIRTSLENELAQEAQHKQHAQKEILEED